MGTNREEGGMVAGNDGDEFAPLQKRVVFADRLRQNAVIEIEPAQFPVDKGL